MLAIRKAEVIQKRGIDVRLADFVLVKLYQLDPLLCPSSQTLVRQKKKKKGLHAVSRREDDMSIRAGHPCLCQPEAHVDVNSR
jgi:hypothetical protein